MPDSEERRVVFNFDKDATYYWQMLVDRSELKPGGRVLESGGGFKGAMPLAAARASTPYVRQLNDISNRSIKVLHTEDRQYKTDESVCLTPSSFRTPVVWGVLLCSLHRLKVMVSCEAEVMESDLRCVITSEDIIQLLRQAHGDGDAEKEALIFDYLRLVPMPSGDLAFIICNVNSLSEEIVLRRNLASPALRVCHSLIMCQHIFRFSVQSVGRST
jgi:hypothetical protein